MIKKFTDWLNQLGKAWASLDYQGAANLYSKDVKYYESALKNSCENWNEVLTLWKVVPNNQKNVTFNFDIISYSEDICVANWKVERTLLIDESKQKIDGIFVFKLNDDGLCNYFKQWRTVEIV